MRKVDGKENEKHVVPRYVELIKTKSAEQFATEINVKGLEKIAYDAVHGIRPKKKLKPIQKLMNPEGNLLGRPTGIDW